VKFKKLINYSKKNSIFILLIFFAFYLLLLADAFAINVNRTVLPNGLTVLHSENHNLPIVMVTMIIKSGQTREPDDKAGLANLTAGLLNEGTKTRTSKDISETIDFIGASLNASAGNDYITVALSVLKKDLNKGFEIFWDIVLNPIFPQHEIERKKQLIKGSLKQREEDPSFLAEKAFIKEVFGEHPYSRLIEGSEETIDKISRDDILKFHSDNFLPNNSILSIAGDITQDELIVLLEKYISEWKKVELPERKPLKFEPYKNKKIVRIDKDITQANIILGNYGISRDNPDYYAVTVMNYILGGGGFASRLMNSIRDEKGLAYDVHSYFAAYKEAGYFQSELQTKNETANVAIDEIIRQIIKIRTEKVTEKELSEAKSYLTGSFPRRLDTTRKIADFLAAIEFFNLGLDYDKKYTDYINSVTEDDILRVANKYLDPENYILVIIANQSKISIPQ